jgi:hypothetical protein
MKHLIWGVVVLIVAGGVLMSSRYDVRISSPIVAKLDRFTGDTWIANAGEWKKVQHAAEKASSVPANPDKGATKAK